jgi:hypothetical protein
MTSYLASPVVGPSQDMFVAKYSSSGQNLWSKAVGNDAEEIGRGLAVDGAGNVIVVGQTGSYWVDLGGGTQTTHGLYDAFIIKYFTSGAYAWSKILGASQDDSTSGVATDAGGNVLVTGYFQNTVNFGGAAFTSAGSRTFVAKYSPTGAPSGRGGSGLGDRHGNAVAVDGSGTHRRRGLQGTVDLAAGISSAGGYDIFVAKYSGVDGSHIWSKRFGSASDDVAFSVALDRTGNIVVAGSFQNSVDFGGGSLSSAGGTDVFVAGYSGSGGYLWLSVLEASATTTAMESLWTA